MYIVNQLIEMTTHYITILGPLFGMFMTFFEGIFPPLPLEVLIALNVKSFGLIFGILISWIGTVLGSIAMYKICEKLFHRFIYKHLKTKTKKVIDKGINRYNEISLPALVIILSIPFSPAFFINLISGISDLSFKKYLIAILISKLIMVSYWGYVGKSLLSSGTDIKTILIIIIVLLVVYFLSKLLSKKLRIK